MGIAWFLLFCFKLFSSCDFVICLPDLNTKYFEGFSLRNTKEFFSIFLSFSHYFVPLRAVLCVTSRYAFLFFKFLLPAVYCLLVFPLYCFTTFSFFTMPFTIT